MFQKKNLMINCDVCDTRKMKEEDYSSYESITINGDIVLVSPASKGILARLPVVQNCSAIVELDENTDVETTVINGFCEITPETAVKKNEMLIVNGSLRVKPDTQAIMENCGKIYVNGSVEIPGSLEGFLSKIQANGSVNVYPGDCTVLDEAFIMDKFFPLRVGQSSRFYAGEEVVIWDKAVDLKKLAEKQVRFVTPRLILPESMVEDSAELFDIQTEYVVVPEGLELVYGDTVLNQDLIREKGSSLFVYGDLDVELGADMNLLAAQIEKLVVTGRVTLSESQKEAYLRIGAACRELKVTKGKILKNKIKVKVDQPLLDSSPEGIEIRNTASVVIEDKVAPEAILDKLSIINCASVICSKMQEGAVTLISENTARIGEEETETGSGLFTMLKDTRLINGSRCVL